MAGDTTAIQLPVLAAADEQFTTASLNTFSQDPPHEDHFLLWGIW
jgi:hypothetical protein